MDSAPRGVAAMRLLFVVGGLLGFVGLYTYFLIEIWTTDAKSPPGLDKQLVYAASVLVGILGAFFAVALGIQRKDPTVDQTRLRLGTTLVGTKEGPGVALATAALWFFFLVGLASVITVIFKSVQAPDSIKALASTFAGYGVAIFGAAFGSPSTASGPPPAPNPAPNQPA
jgi:hypothetical protein